MIRTQRLLLIPALHSALEAELSSRSAFADATGFVVPDSWPPDLYDENAVRWTIESLRSADPAAKAFYSYYITLDGPHERIAVGICGFKGPPADGRVELGYSVLAQYRRRGFASEAVEGMLVFAFAHPQVQEVIAETLPELVASIGVLTKTGFSLLGVGSEEGVIRFAISRPRWAARGRA